MAVVSQLEEEGGSAAYLHVDLASLDSCRRAGEEFVGSGRMLDVFIANAGVGGVRGLTEDGFEIAFGVNHLGHFMLTEELGRSLRPDARVVVVSSDTATFSTRSKWICFSYGHPVLVCQCNPGRQTRADIISTVTSRRVSGKGID